MPSHLTGFVCPTVSMVTTSHATGVEYTIPFATKGYEISTSLICPWDASQIYKTTSELYRTTASYMLKSIVKHKMNFNN